MCVYTIEYKYMTYMIVRYVMNNYKFNDNLLHNEIQTLNIHDS